MCIPSASGVSEAAACPWSPIADDSSTPPFPTSFASSSYDSSCPCAGCQSLCASCCSVLFRILYCKVKNVFFFVCLLLMYYLCEKYYKPVTEQFSSVAQSCPTLCNPMNRSPPGLPVHHQLPEFTQTQVH